MRGSCASPPSLDVCLVLPNAVPKCEVLLVPWPQGHPKGHCVPASIPNPCFEDPGLAARKGPWSSARAALIPKRFLPLTKIRVKLTILRIPPAVTAAWLGKL